MGKYKLYLLLLALFSFGSQGLATAFQVCSETAGTPVESQPGVIETERGCHQTGVEKDDTYDTCDAWHCCPGATFSAVYPSGQPPVNMDKACIGYPDRAYIYSYLNDIYHPPKPSL